jgi:hypothetical protein
LFVASNILAVVTAFASIEAFNATDDVPLNVIPVALIPPPVIEKVLLVAKAPAIEANSA